MTHNFRTGDRVELRAKGTVANISISPTSVTIAVKFDDDFFVAKKYAAQLNPKLLTNLSIGREMSAEEAKKLMDDEI